MRRKEEDEEALSPGRTTKQPCFFVKRHQHHHHHITTSSSSSNSLRKRKQQEQKKLNILLLWSRGFKKHCMILAAICCFLFFNCAYLLQVEALTTSDNLRSREGPRLETRNNKNNGKFCGIGIHLNFLAKWNLSAAYQPKSHNGEKILSQSHLREKVVLIPAFRVNCFKSLTDFWYLTVFHLEANSPHLFVQDPPCLEIKSACKSC